MRPALLAPVLLALLLLEPAERATAGPDQSSGEISGRITIGDEGVPGVISVRRRLPNLPHFYNFWRQAAHIHRVLDSVPQEDRPWTKCQARDDGWFRIADLPPACYDVRVEGPRGYWGGAGVPILVPGQHVEIDIPLLSGGRVLQGRVGYADGRPFRGRVVAFQKGVRMHFGDAPKARYGRSTLTDREGRFRIEGLSQAPTIVVAHSPGRRWQHMPTPAEPGKEVLFVLDDDPRPFRGQVLDIETRKPIEGATLTWTTRWDGTERAYGMATSDSDGRFEVPRPKGCTTIEELHVHVPGYGRRRYEYVRSDGSFVAHMRRAARIEGRVVDPEGRGVPGIHVRVKHRSWRKRGGRRPLFSEEMQVGLNEPVLTDASGRFVHEDLDWGDVDLYARGRGWIPAGLASKDRFEELQHGPDHLRRPYRLRPGETLSVTLHVERGAVMRGVLRDKAGRPVVGVPLTFDSDGGDPLFGWLGYERPPLAATDAQGGFVIEGLLPGSSFELHARRMDYPKVVVRTPSLTREPQPPIQLEGLGATRYARAVARPVTPKRDDAPEEQSHGRWILLQVVAADTGKPIVGAHVHAMMNPRPGSSKRFEIEWTTDKDGRVRMGPFGEMTGDASVEDADGYIDRNGVYFGMPTTEGKPFTVVLEKKFDIRGRVLLPDGRPAAGGRLEIRNLDGDGMAHYRNAVRIGKDGSYFSGYHVHAEVTYEVKASYWDDVRGYEATVTVLGRDGPKDITLVAVPGSEDVVRERRERLRVRVIGPGDRPVARAEIRLGDQVPATFEGGVAIFDERVTADDELRIWDAAAEDGWPLSCGPFRLARVGRATGVLAVRLPEERQIGGVLLKPDGTPMRGVQVTARVASTADPMRPAIGIDHADDRTDAKGHFLLRRLGDELYELRFATPEALLPPTPHLRIKPPVDEIVVRLREPVDIRLRIVDEQGKPLADASVTVGIPFMKFSRWLGESETLRATRHAKTDASGLVTLSGIDADAKYQMQVGVEIGGERAWMQVDDWSPRVGDVVFKPGER